MPDKAQLRKLVRGASQGREAIAAQSAALCRHVLAWETYRQARVVAGYMPLGWEADITPILLDALQSGKTLALPRVGPARQMTFHRVHSLEELFPGPWGLREPSPQAKVIAPGEIDLVLTPLEAVSSKGVRLGKGGGYYDALLEKTGAVALGIALSWQWSEDIPADPWDRPLHAAASSAGVTVF